MTVPEEAVKKLTRVVDQLSREVVLGKDNWETVVYFQNMLVTKSTSFLLAEIAVEMRKRDSRSIDWSTVVRALENLEETNQDIALQFPAKLKVLAALQQDAVDMLQIPRDNTTKLQKFLDIMKETYDGDFPQIYHTIQALVDAYQQGTEDEVLQRKPFARDRIVAKFQAWLTHAVSVVEKNSTNDTKHNDTREPNNTRHDQKRKRHPVDGTTRERLRELRQARGKLSEAVVVDPLEEIRKASSLATRGEQLYTKKMSARKLEFSDDEEIEEEDDEVHATHELSEIPAKLKPPRPREPSPDRSVESSPGKKRWTQKQKTAFVSALREYGVGNWAAIRDSQHYRKYWRNRNNVQLKDLYRTMKQGGHIPEDML